MIVLAVLAIGIFVFRFWARMDTMNAAIADLTVRVGALERSRSVAVPAPEACPHRNRRFNRRCQAITAADARQRRRQSAGGSAAGDCTAVDLSTSAPTRNDCDA